MATRGGKVLIHLNKNSGKSSCTTSNYSFILKYIVLMRLYTLLELILEAYTAVFNTVLDVKIILVLIILH